MNQVISMLPVDELNVDMRYQRDENSQLVKKIVEHFEEALFSPLVVSCRTNKGKKSYYVVDGQHRLSAAKKLGYTEVPCFVYDNLPTMREGMLFVNQQMASRRLTPRDVYKANLFISDPLNTDVIIDKTLKKYDHRLGAHTHDLNGWWCIVALRDTVKQVGEQGLSEILIALNELNWRQGRAAHSRIILVGMSHAIKLGVSVTDIVRAFGSEYDDAAGFIGKVYSISKGRKPTAAVLDVVDNLLEKLKN